MNDHRITRSISYLPKHESILSAAQRARPELKGNVSLLFRELLEDCLDPETGRAKNCSKTRTPEQLFEEDCATVLAAAKLQYEQNATIEGTKHRADFLVHRGNKRCIVELRSSGRKDRLELALGSALILARETALPLVICVPYILEMDLVNVFETIRITLCTPSNLAQATTAALQK